MTEKNNTVDYSPCEKCTHEPVCKMKREYARFVNRVDSVDKTLTDNGVVRFPSFNAHTLCTQFLENGHASLR